LALQELGPIFVKFGQALSTRPDLIPLEIASELALLQDRVDPFSGEEALKVVEQALRAPIAHCFDTFDLTPLASASVAQVHAATLKEGEQVVVKIIRPGIRQVIAQDIALLRSLARLAERYWPAARPLRPVEVVDEFARYLEDELDLMREAANASLLKRQFEGSEDLSVPAVYWAWTRESVMVMERVSGERITDTARLTQAGTDLKKLAERGVKIFFTQVFCHNFFHADMHPGNLFVDISDPSDPRYIAMDFGIMGSLVPEEQQALAHIFHAFFRRDYRRVAEIHARLGWIGADVRIDEFEAAIRTVCEPIFEKPLGEISFGMLLVSLFRAARRFNMEIQPQLLLLQKTLLNIEGLGRALYPELDLWQTARPFMEQWVKEQNSPVTLGKKVWENLPLWLGKAADLPDRLDVMLKQHAELYLQHRKIGRDVTGSVSQPQRRGWAAGMQAVGVGGLVLAGGMIWVYDPALAGGEVLMWIRGCVATGLLLWVAGRLGQQ
jgi:ubiquinone biosynthesis protein